MGKHIDLTGERINRLLVMSLCTDSERGNLKHIKWICKCDCGNIKIIRSDALVSGRVKSCGCIIKEINSKRLKKYDYYVPEYKIWVGI